MSGKTIANGLLAAQDTIGYNDPGGRQTELLDPLFFIFGLTSHRDLPELATFSSPARDQEICFYCFPPRTGTKKT